MIELLVSDETKGELLKLAGNSKSVTFPCNTVPKVIDKLLNSPPYSGHDSFLGLIPVRVDANLSKVSRCILFFKYGKYLNVSSQSLMHKEKELSGMKLEEIPSSFEYGVSFTTNMRLLKRMVFDLFSFDNLPDDLFNLLVEVKDFLLSQGVAVSKSPVKNGVVAPSYVFFGNRLCIYNTKPDYDVEVAKIDEQLFYINISNVDIALLEQLLRYSSSIIFTDLYLIRECLLQDPIHAVSFVATKEQLNIIVNQRKTHKLKEWLPICETFEKL